MADGGVELAEQFVDIPLDGVEFALEGDDSLMMRHHDRRAPNALLRELSVATVNSVLLLPSPLLL